MFYYNFECYVSDTITYIPNFHNRFPCLKKVSDRFLFKLFYFFISENDSKYSKFYRFSLKCIIITLLVTLLLDKISSQPQREVECSNRDCLREVEIITRNRKPNVKPCEDFYEHACGNWRRWHSVPEDVAIWGSTDILGVETVRTLRALLTSTSANDRPLIKKAKQAFRVCMNTAAQDRNGVQPLIDETNLVGGWPIIIPVKDYQNTREEWDSADYKYTRRTGKSALLQISVENNKGVRKIQLDRPAFLYQLQLKLLAEVPTEELYTQFISTFIPVFVQANGNKLPQDEVQRDIENLIEFRKQLRQIMVERDFGPTEKRPQTISELQTWSNNILASKRRVRAGFAVNWFTYIKETFMHATGVTIHQNDPIVIKHLQYIKLLIILLSRTPKRTVLNHIHLYFVETHLQYVNDAMRQKLSHFYSVSHQGPLKERLQECIEDHQMSHIVSKMFVTEYFPVTSRTAIQNLMRDLNFTMVRQITQSPWLDANTKQAALAKMRTLDVLIGFNDWLMNERILGQYYQHQEVGNIYLKNVLSYKQNEYTHHLKTLTGPRLIPEEKQHPYNINGYYHFPTNHIEFQAALLQWPFYSSLMPDILKYAITGSIIAHEMSHIFSIKGMERDHHGRVVDWWSGNTRARYNDKIRCIMQQYQRNSRGIPPQHYDALKTIDEDFADVLSTSIILDAYKRRIDTTRTVTKLKGFQATDHQLFFYAFGNTYCEYVDQARIVEVISDDIHSLPRMRVNGPLMNLPEFSAAFSCRSGSVMNPVQKCNIWK